MRRDGAKEFIADIERESPRAVNDARSDQMPARRKFVVALIARACFTANGQNGTRGVMIGTFNALGGSVIHYLAHHGFHHMGNGGIENLLRLHLGIEFQQSLIGRIDAEFQGFKTLDREAPPLG